MALKCDNEARGHEVRIAKTHGRLSYASRACSVRAICERDYVVNDPYCIHEAMLDGSLREIAAGPLKAHRTPSLISP